MTTLEHFMLAKIPVDGREITIFSLDLPFLPGSNIVFERCLRAIGCCHEKEKIDDDDE